MSVYPAMVREWILKHGGLSPDMKRLKTHLEDVRLPGVQGLDAINVNVDADNLMAELRHTCGMGGTQIVCANNAHPQCHPQILPQLTNG